MATTNTKAIITANQNHIVKHMGGKKAFYDQVTYLMKSYRGMTAGRAIEKMVDGGDFLVYNVDIQKYLGRIIPNFDPKRVTGPKLFSTYKSLMARDGAKLYAALKKDHPTW